VTYFFFQNSNGLKGRGLTNIIRIKAQLQDIPAEFQTLQFMKTLHTVAGDCCKEDSIDWMVSVVVEK
jgi:hypothetical protein